VSAIAWNTQNHYPAADIRDRETGAIAYYHAHSAAERLKDEHGHFHIFVPRDGKGGRRAGTGYSHLVGISVTARGEALRLFTTNRWVTGEDWLPASRLAELLEDFRLVTTGKLAPVARWLTAMTCIYGADIGALLDERDTVIASHSRSRRREATLEDRSIHIVTEKPVYIPERLLQIDADFSAR